MHLIYTKNERTHKITNCIETDILLSKGGHDRDIGEAIQLGAEVGKTDFSFTSLNLDYAGLKSEVGLQQGKEEKE